MPRSFQEPPQLGQALAWVPLCLLLGAAGACGSEAPMGADAGPATGCEAFAPLVQNGGPGKDGIPALSQPELVAPGDPHASYLRPSDRVVGVRVGGEAVAVPLNIGWWHEIVNLDLGGARLAITHCPLTGSSMAFDRAPLGGAEFGVSGLLYQNNLIMYDRSTEESLWPQMSRIAQCGPASGSQLSMHPVVESTWESWLAAHPGTRVVSSETGHDRDYRLYPYGTYDRVDSNALLFPMPLDSRRPPKERVLAIPRGTSGGMAFPFGELARLGSHGAVDLVFGEQTTPTGLRNVVVLWDSAGAAAMAYSRRIDDAVLTFESVSSGIVDVETGSTWGVHGVATEGPLAGRALEAIAEAYVAYWFAWAAFAPNTEIWRSP